MDDGQASGRVTPRRADRATSGRGPRLRRWLVGGASAGATAAGTVLLLCPTAGTCGACGACAGLIPMGVAVAAVAKAALGAER
jgi:hypothetical protein